MIFGAIERARDARLAAVKGRVGCGTDVELGELVELNVDFVLRATLALGLDFLGLRIQIR